MKKTKFLLMVIITITLFSCKRTAIEGVVKDGFGNPIKDVVVSIDGTQFTSKTDDNGEYSVEYVPGDIKVNISKVGYTDTSFNLKIATETTYPIATATVYEIPKEKGVWVMDYGSKQYEKIKIATTSVRSWSTSEWFTSVCYEVYSVLLVDGNAGSNSNYTIINSNSTQSEITFIDNDENNISLVKLNNDNANQYEILSRTINNCSMGFAMGDFRDKINFENSSYSIKGSNVGIRKVNLNKGSVYAFVNYNKRSSKPVPQGIYLFKVE